LTWFPAVADLAAADADEVMGFGNWILQPCAQFAPLRPDVVALHAALFRRPQQLQTLPGIGRSTAAAIASSVLGERWRFWTVT
jgi:A/G-specific adenine glycosylase